MKSTNNVLATNEKSYNNVDFVKNKIKTYNLNNENKKNKNYLPIVKYKNTSEKTKNVDNCMTTKSLNNLKNKNDIIRTGKYANEKIKVSEQINVNEKIKVNENLKHLKNRIPLLKTNILRTNETNKSMNTFKYKSNIERKENGEEGDIIKDLNIYNDANKCMEKNNSPKNEIEKNKIEKLTNINNITNDINNNIILEELSNRNKEKTIYINNGPMKKDTKCISQIKRTSININNKDYTCNISKPLIRRSITFMNTGKNIHLNKSTSSINNNENVLNNKKINDRMYIQNKAYIPQNSLIKNKIESSNKINNINTMNTMSSINNNNNNNNRNSIMLVKDINNNNIKSLTKDKYNKIITPISPVGINKKQTYKVSNIIENTISPILIPNYKKIKILKPTKIINPLSNDTFHNNLKKKLINTIMNPPAPKKIIKKDINDIYINKKKINNIDFKKINVPINKRITTIINKNEHDNIIISKQLTHKKNFIEINKQPLLRRHSTAILNHNISNLKTKISNVKDKNDKIYLNKGNITYKDNNTHNNHDKEKIIKYLPINNIQNEQETNIIPSNVLINQNVWTPKIMIIKKDNNEKNSNVENEIDNDNNKKNDNNDNNKKNDNNDNNKKNDNNDDNNKKNDNNDNNNNNNQSCVEKSNKINALFNIPKRLSSLIYPKIKKNFIAKINRNLNQTDKKNDDKNIDEKVNESLEKKINEPINEILVETKNQILNDLQNNQGELNYRTNKLTNDNTPSEYLENINKEKYILKEDIECHNKYIAHTNIMEKKDNKLNHVSDKNITYNDKIKDTNETSVSLKLKEITSNDLLCEYREEVLKKFNNEYINEEKNEIINEIYPKRLSYDNNKTYSSSCYNNTKQKEPEMIHKMNKNICSYEEISTYEKTKYIYPNETQESINCDITNISKDNYQPDHNDKGYKTNNLNINQKGNHNEEILHKEISHGEISHKEISHNDEISPIDKIYHNDEISYHDGVNMNTCEQNNNIKLREKQKEQIEKYDQTIKYIIDKNDDEIKNLFVNNNNDGEIIFDNKNIQDISEDFIKNEKINKIYISNNCINMYEEEEKNGETITKILNEKLNNIKTNQIIEHKDKNKIEHNTKGVLQKKNT
ncbi:hypothetical protein PFMALIP_01481 [Plasmodium falciparum MaliPS096_E11]|uniref:Uncharacterized protein n=1 Tax=Plasmodium falciparum MaliPS096_E11 TaxID=1036727 RepID=A0A024WUS4_PLAFA|nr:hypothetical protein PFMALIP_01481 [Plasmodium falciparum MaliPS096_E11]